MKSALRSVIERLRTDALAASQRRVFEAGRGRQPALAAQIWLTGGAIDAVDDATHILEIEGSASSSG